MRILPILLLVGFWTAQGFADEGAEPVVLGDCDKSGQGFSLVKGEPVKFIDDTRKVGKDVDILFDLPHGLAANNMELAKVFTGKAGVIDLGEVSLDSEVEIPAEGYSFALKPEEILVGHSYLVRCADGVSIGKIHILNMDAENETLTFSWRLLVPVQE